MVGLKGVDVQKKKKRTKEAQSYHCAKRHSRSLSLVHAISFGE